MEEAKTTDLKALLAAKREEGAQRLLSLYLQRRRLAQAVTRLDAEIAAYEREIDYADGILSLP